MSTEMKSAGTKQDFGKSKCVNYKKKKKQKQKRVAPIYLLNVASLTNNYRSSLHAKDVTITSAPHLAAP